MLERLRPVQHLVQLRRPQLRLRHLADPRRRPQPDLPALLPPGRRLHLPGDRRFDERSPAARRSPTSQQEVRQAGDVSTLSVAAAYQLTQRMSLGLTLSRWLGDWSFATRPGRRRSPRRGAELTYGQQTTGAAGTPPSACCCAIATSTSAPPFAPASAATTRSTRAWTTNFPTPFEPSLRTSKGRCVGRRRGPPAWRSSRATPGSSPPTTRSSTGTTWSSAASARSR